MKSILTGIIGAVALATFSVAYADNPSTEATEKSAKAHYKAAEKQAKADYKWEPDLIEHQPQAEPAPEPAPDPIEEQPSPDEPPELARLTIADLKKLAGVSDVE